MSTIKYCGDQPLDLPSLGLTVAPGDIVEVDTEAAASLLARDDFKRPTAAKKKAAPVKAAPKASGASVPGNKSQED